MGIATALSLILIAAGAILTWAVTATVSGLDITAGGVILMVVGLVGLMISLLSLASFAPFAPFARTRVHNEEVVHDL